MGGWPQKSTPLPPPLGLFYHLCEQQSTDLWGLERDPSCCCTPKDVPKLISLGMRRKRVIWDPMSCCVGRRQSHDFGTSKASQSAECPGEQSLRYLSLFTLPPCTIHTYLPRLVDPSRGGIVACLHGWDVENLGVKRLHWRHAERPTTTSQLSMNGGKAIRIANQCPAPTVAAAPATIVDT